MIIDLQDREICPQNPRLLTGQIQRCLNDIDAAGGGELIIPPGKYCIGSLELPSNLVLRLEPGAMLIASENSEDYAHVSTQSSAELSQRVLLYACRQHHITICGAGSIHGQDEAWFDPQPDSAGYRMPLPNRPRMLVFEQCKQINLQDFSICHAPLWTIHLACCQHINLNHITVDNDLYLPNTDSLDIDSCQFVTISNCTLSAADDGVCLKTTAKSFGDEQKMHHIAVSNCLIRSRGAAVKIGSETFADVEDIVVNNITVFDSNRAIALVSRDGGQLRRMIFSNITFECRLCVPHHWGKAEPVAVSVRYRDPNIMPGKIENIVFSNLSGSAHGAFHLYSELQNHIDDITFSTIYFAQQKTDYGDFGFFDIRPPCNPFSPTGMGVDNSYKINPATGKPYGVEGYDSGIPAFYAVGVSHLKIRHLTTRRENPADPAWDQTQEIVTLDAPVLS